MKKEQLEKDRMDCRIRYDRVTEIMEELWEWETSPSDEIDKNLIHDIYCDLAFYKEHLAERWNELFEQINNKYGE